MGNVNVTCAVSGLSIYEGDRAVFIPLMPFGSAYEKKDFLIRPKSMSFSSTEEYTPVFFGIKGSYDGFGSLVDIDSSTTTLIVEKLFKISVGDFVQLIVSEAEKADYKSVNPNLSQQKMEFLQSFSGMYILEDIYKEMTTSFFDYSGMITDNRKKISSSLQQFRLNNKELQQQFKGEPFEAAVSHFSKDLSQNKYDFLSIMITPMEFFQIIYLPRILYFEELEADTIEMYMLFCNMSLANRMFRPQLALGSEPKDHVQELLLLKSLDIINARKKNTDNGGESL